jgi:predicted MPP superfamily phosphohydrolase
VILLLGDYVSAMKLVTGDVSPEAWSKSLSKLHAPLGVHAVLGNHDWWHDEVAQQAGAGPTVARRALEAVGIPVYENDAVRLVKDGRPFWLAGLGDQIALLPMRRLRPDRRIGVDDLDGMLAKITDDSPVILMAHEPDVMPRVPDRVSLMFSGHTHGGQVRLLGWSPVVPSRYKNRYAYGHIREQCDLIVSGGLGMSIFPLRFGMLPEIVLVNVGAERAS